MKTYLFILFIHSLSKLFLKKHNDLLNILARNHLQCNAQGLSPNINIGAGENAQDLHSQILQHTLIANTQLIHTIQHNKLNVVIGLPNGELNQLGGRGLHGDRVAGQSSKRGSSLVDHSACRSVEELKHEFEIARLGSVSILNWSQIWSLGYWTHLVLRVLDRILAQEFQLRQLEQLIGVGNGIKSRAEVLKRLLMADRSEGCKGITLAGAVGLRFKEGLEEFGGVGNEGLGVLEDRGDCPSGVLSYVGMAVFQTRAGRGQERLDEFRFAEFAQETKSISTNVFVGVLQVVANAIAANLLVHESTLAMRPPYQTRIISCFSLPEESCLGQIS